MCFESNETEKEETAQEREASHVEMEVEVGERQPQLTCAWESRGQTALLTP